MFKDRWVVHAIAVPSVTRTIDCFKRVEGKVKRVEYQEMVHQHDVYRSKDGDKIGKTLWHRGAKVGTV